MSRVGGREGDHFVSPSEQAQRIRDACKRDGLKLIGDPLQEMDVSGGAQLEQRPALGAALQMIENGDAEVVVAAYFDRLVRGLSRQAEILERVEKAGGSVLTVDVGEVRTDTAATWLSSTMIGAVAEYQRRSTGERTREGKRRAVAMGVPPFPNIPPGLRRKADGTIEPDPKEKKIVAKAFQLRADGSTVMDVRDYLGRHGIERSFHGVTSLLANPIYLGELHFGELVNENSHTAIVDKKLWQRVQRTRSTRGRPPKSDRLLARLGVLRCGTCGSRMVVGTANHGGYHLYRCPPIGDCPQRVTISADLIETAVVDEVQRLLEGISERASVKKDVQTADRELERAERELNAAFRAFDGFDDVPAARERLLQLRDAHNEARDRADELRAAVAPAIKISARDWSKLSLSEQRALIVAVIDEVTVIPGRGPDRIAIVSK